MTDPAGGSAQPGSPPPNETGLSQPPGQNSPGAANVASPGTPPPAPDVEQTTAVLATGDPQSFYAAAQRFQGMCDGFVDVTDRIRAQATHLEQVWTGLASRGFTEAMRDLNRTVDKLIETLSAPSYGSLLNQLGDALAEAQRQAGQVKDQRQQERDQFTASPSVADPTAQAALRQQETAHNERSAQVLQQLSNTYHNIGKQFGQFPEKSVSGTPVVEDAGSSPSEGGSGFGGDYAVSTGSGGVLAPAVVGTYSPPIQASGQGVLGRTGSTYGTSNGPAEVYSAELTEQGVVMPQGGLAFGAVPGLGSGSRRSSGKPVESTGRAPTDGVNSGNEVSAQERSGWADGDQRSGDHGQPFTESTFDAPEKAKLGDGLAEQQFAEAVAGPQPAGGVKPDLVPESPQGPGLGAPLPDPQVGNIPTGTLASSGGSISSASIPSVSTPSMPSPGAGLISSGPPGTVAGTGATAPGMSATGLPPASSATPPAVGEGGAAGSGMPMMPMGGMGGMGAGMAGQVGRERFPTILQQEDEDTWGSDGDITGGVLGR